MNVLIAPDSFKGTMSALQVAKIIASGMSALPDINCKIMPLADGGEGSLELLNTAINGQRVNLSVYNPAGHQVSAYYIRNKHVAYIEVAQASGITLIGSNERQPLVLNSYGTGQIIRDAIECNSKEIHLFLGGSATVDGGTGIVNALSTSEFNLSNTIFKPCDLNLDDFGELIRNVRFKIITDVMNTITGVNGAVITFGPQKGVKPNQLPMLENAMVNYVDYLSNKSGKQLHTVEGLGAAGGMALPLVAMSDVFEIVSGFNYFNQLFNYSDAIAWADVLVTGEGCIDEQTAMGKGPGLIADMAHQMGKLVIGVGGIVKEKPISFDHVIATTEDDGLSDQTLKQLADKNLKIAVQQLISIIQQQL